MSFIACHRNIRISGSPHCVSITDLAADDPTPIRISDPAIAAALTEALSGLVARHRHESRPHDVAPSVVLCTHCGDILDVDEDGHGSRGDICDGCQKVRVHLAIVGIDPYDWQEMTGSDERFVPPAWSVAALRSIRSLALAQHISPYEVCDNDDLWDQVVDVANEASSRGGKAR